MKTLGAVMICGMRVPVRTGSEKDHPSLRGTYGLYDIDQVAIWVNADTPAHMRDFITVHESLHAILNNSGALRSVATTAGLDLEDRKDFQRMEVLEENLIRILVPHILETFGPARVVR